MDRPPFSATFIDTPFAEPFFSASFSLRRRSNSAFRSSSVIVSPVVSRSMLRAGRSMASPPFNIALPEHASCVPTFAGMPDRLVLPLALEPELADQSLELARRQLLHDARQQSLEQRDAIRER